MEPHGIDVRAAIQQDLFGEVPFLKVPSEKTPGLYVANALTGDPKFWIKTEPSVYLAGGTQINLGEEGRPGLHDFWTDERLNPITAEQWDVAGDKGNLVELAGRLCYWSFQRPRPGGHAAYMQRILSEGHGSVLEHAHFNFIITGVSRTFTHELVRHRLASYSQLSQRYFNEVNCAFICPPETVRRPASFDRWLDTMETCYRNYVDQVEDFESDSTAFRGYPDKTSRRKAILGEARSQLPNAIETKIVLSCNARCLRGILDQRGVPGADQEIRRVAIKLFDLVNSDSPSLFGDYERREVAPFGMTISTPYRKV